MLSWIASTENKASAVLLWGSSLSWHVSCGRRREEEGHREVRKVIVTVEGKRDGGKPRSLWAGGTWC